MKKSRLCQGASSTPLLVEYHTPANEGGMPCKNYQPISAPELTPHQCDLEQVSQILKARWPEGHVHQFGSTANCLAITNNNDIDICLELTDLEDDPVLS